VVSNQLGEILGTGTASTGDQQVAGFEPDSRHVEQGDFFNMGQSPASLRSPSAAARSDADLVETAENR
jgi:hypothetical protein